MHFRLLFSCTAIFLYALHIHTWQSIFQLVLVLRRETYIRSHFKLQICSCIIVVVVGIIFLRHAPLGYDL